MYPKYFRPSFEPDGCPKGFLVAVLPEFQEVLHRPRLAVILERDEDNKIVFREKGGKQIACVAQATPIDSVGHVNSGSFESCIEEQHYELPLHLALNVHLPKKAELLGAVVDRAPTNGMLVQHGNHYKVIELVTFDVVVVRMEKEAIELEEEKLEKTG